MRRINALLLVVAIAGCATAYDRCVKPEITAATKLAPADLAKEVAAFLMCDIASPEAMAAPCAVKGLADLAIAIGPGGDEAVNCLVSYFMTNAADSKLKSRAKAVGAKRGVTREMFETHACNGAPGRLALRSPGDATTKTGPTAACEGGNCASREVPILSGEFSLSSTPPDLLIVSARNADLAAEVMDCGPSMRSVTPMAPGVVCLRNGVTFTEVLCKMKASEAKPYPYTATFSGSGDPWAEAVIDLMRALPSKTCPSAG